MFSSTESGSSAFWPSDALHNSEQICLRYDPKTDKFAPFRVWKWNRGWRFCNVHARKRREVARLAAASIQRHGPLYGITNIDML